ncbi:hypothetical protein SAMN05216464_10666 [Mucilaginibacter pineti]|uniref:Uncharacterized protein n=1 Tax=Mucilaginibacter pineti TaxID=1391627 RepID=A0A1G7CRE2_9SPHI|nr:hypothetical protein [Mucilaginibacter pineti]SDE41877.1 hypothetical protein SAMN05216464_10666 [Mucilaginibacter pineti]
MKDHSQEYGVLEVVGSDSRHIDLKIKDVRLKKAFRTLIQNTKAKDFQNHSKAINTA